MFTILKRHDIDRVIEEVLARNDPRVETAVIELRRAPVDLRHQQRRRDPLLSSLDV